MSNSTGRATGAPDDQVKSILTYLEDEDKLVHYPTDETPQITLFLGITGSGKSTLVEYIAGDNKNLKSEAVFSKKGRVVGYRITDVNRKIGNALVQSHTKVPELTIDPITNTALYDCPGFEDNREAKYDIGGAYFIKKIIDKAKAIKFVFVVNYNSVTSNMNKTDFAKLLEHVTGMIKNVQKFTDAFCLVATKVDDGKNDEAVVDSIATYLQQVKEELESEAEQDKNEGIDDSSVDSQQRARNIQLLDALLQEQDGKYLKIGFIRQPNRAGFISDIQPMQERKESLIQLIHYDTKFVASDGDDFSYTISSDSLNHVSNLQQEIYHRISRHIDDLIDAIRHHYDDSMQEVDQLLQSFVVDKKVPVTVDPSAAKTIIDRLHRGVTMIKKFLDQTKNSTTADEFFQKLRENMAAAEMQNTVFEPLARVSELANLFTFLQTFSRTSLNIESWTKSFKTIASNLDQYVISLPAKFVELEHSVVNETRIKSGDAIKSYFSAIEASSNDIEDIRRAIELGHRQVSKIRTVVAAANVTSTRCVQQIIDAFATLNITSGDSALYTVDENLRILNYVKNLNIQQRQSEDSYECTSGLDNAIEYLDRSKTWYDFVSDLYDRLSQYDIQNDTKKFIEYRAVRVTSLDEHEHKKFDAVADMKIFLQQCCHHLYSTQYDIIKSIVPDKFKLRALKRAIDTTLKTSSYVTCHPSESKLRIRGQFVKLSDIVDKACPTPVKFIEVFALDTIFVDASLNKTGDQVQLTMMAPRWEVRDQQTIVLDGQAAPPMTPSKAQNAIYHGADGENGRCGLKGGPAGHFLGFAEISLNSKNLTISAIGGRGGIGQDGGDGADGYRVPQNSTFTFFEGSTWGLIPHYRTYNPFSPYVKQGFGLWINVGDCYTRYNGKSTSGKYCEVDATLYKEGENGGNGGAGGCGGEGGDRGEVYIITADSSSPLIDNSNGPTGLPGAGGRGGEAGRSSNGFYARIIQHTFNSISDMENALRYDDSLLIDEDQPTQNYRNWFLHYWYEELSLLLPGKTGVSGQRTQRKSQSHRNLASANLSFAVNSYKDYLRENLDGNIREGELREFLDHLQRNQLILDLYDVHGFVDELRTLEEQYSKLRDKLSFLPFYKSLLRNVDAHSRAYKFTESNQQYKKVLNYLHTAIVARIRNVNGKNNDFIVDLPFYITNTVLEEINSLKTKTRQVQISESNRIYHTKIDQKINETRHFIESQVMPEIDNAIEQTDNQIRYLIGEIADARNASQQQYNRIAEHQRELEQQMGFKKIFTVMQGVLRYFSFAVPFGEMVSAVIGGVSTVTQSYLPGNTTSVINDLKELSEDVKKSTSAMRDQINSPNRYLKSELDNAKTVLDCSNQNEPTDLSMERLKQKISCLREQIEQNESNDILTTNKINDDLIADLKSNLDEYDRQLETKKSKDHTESNWKTASKRLKIALNGGRVILDTLQKLHDDETTASDNLILLQRAGQNIARLEHHESKIYQLMIPSLKTVWDIIDENKNTLSTQSLPQLDITRWKIRDTLNDLKLLVEKMTQGFESGKEMKRCTEKVEYAMTTMIQMYDRIQQYRENKDFADYLFDINSEKINSIEITDKRLEQFVDSLKRMIQANMVLQHYQRTLQAFLQHQFPFGHLSLTEYELPSYLQLKSTDDLVDQAVEKILKMRDQLNKDRALINHSKVSRKFVKIQFSGQDNNFPPFFTWKHDPEIHTKLLQGQEIVLEANIADAGIIATAVKFNEIGIRLKFADETSQAQFDRETANLSVEMIHLGNSYYRCGQKIYIIEHDSQLITHSLNQNKDGRYIIPNGVYDKIQENPPVLSPYAWWIIKLKDSKHGNYNFHTLNKYSNYTVDLQLVGLGEYMNIDETNAYVCDDLDDYYTLYKILPEINDAPATQSINRRKRRNVNDTTDNPDAPPSTSQYPELTAKSSASSLASPINSLFNWITNIFQPSAKIIDSVPVGNTFLRFKDKLPSEIPPSFQNSENSTPLWANTSIFDLNPALFLADFAIRYFTKTKPVGVDAESVDLSQVRACVLEIVTDFENLLENISEETSIRLEFQPVTLMGQLETAIINARDPCEITNILYKSVVVENDGMAFAHDETSFGNYLMEKIAPLSMKPRRLFANSGFSDSSYSGESLGGTDGKVGIILPNENKNIDFRSNMLFIDSV